MSINCISCGQRLPYDLPHRRLLEDLNKVLGMIDLYPQENELPIIQLYKRLEHGIVYETSDPVASSFLKLYAIISTELSALDAGSLACGASDIVKVLEKNAPVLKHMYAVIPILKTGREEAAKALQTKYDEVLAASKIGYFPKSETSVHEPATLDDVVDAIANLGSDLHQDA